VIPLSRLFRAYAGCNYSHLCNSQPAVALSQRYTLLHTHLTGQEANPSNPGVDFVQTRYKRTPEIQLQEGMPNSPDNENSPQPDWASMYHCQAISACVACQGEELAESYCMKTGYKQKIECQWNSNVPQNEKEILQLPPPFRTCEEVVKEIPDRWQFTRFQIGNLFLSVLAAFIVLWRKRALRTEKYRRLQQKIVDS